MNYFQSIVEALRSLLMFFYGFSHDYLISIVLLTLVIKLILHPLTRIQLRSMKGMQLLAPHIEGLRRKHKENPQTLQKEMMALYRTHNVNPMMGCLPMLVQMPVLWALFRLLYTKNLFGDATVFGIPWMRLDHRPGIDATLLQHPERLALFVFPLLAGLTTWWQQRISVTDPQQARMVAFFPIMTAYFATLYPIGLSVYWIVSTIAYMGEYFLVVGRPNPMTTAPPKSQVQGSGGGGGPKPQVASPPGDTSQQALGDRPQGSGRRSNLPQGKRGAKRA